MNTFNRNQRIQENEHSIQHHQEQQETRTASMLPDCEIKDQFLPYPPVIDLDAIDDDDDVVESTASAFAEAKSKKARRARQALAKKLEKPKVMAPQVEQKFNCPICLGPFTEEMSTKCGHIFCRSCIMKVTSAETASTRCPTCRKKITAKELIRVFLPATK